MEIKKIEWGGGASKILLGRSVTGYDVYCLLENNYLKYEIAMDTKTAHFNNRVSTEFRGLNLSN